jgi:hypothetical protein
LESLFISISIDCTEITKSRKGVRTSYDKACGGVTSSSGNEIFVVNGAVKVKKYRIPKSKIHFYNGAELFLEIPTALMQNMNINNIEMKKFFIDFDLID